MYARRRAGDMRRTFVARRNVRLSRIRMPRLRRSFLIIRTATPIGQTSAHDTFFARARSVCVSYDTVSAKLPRACASCVRSILPCAYLLLRVAPRSILDGLPLVQSVVCACASPYHPTPRLARINAMLVLSASASAMTLTFGWTCLNASRLRPAGPDHLGGFAAHAGTAV